MERILKHHPGSQHIPPAINAAAEVHVLGLFERSAALSPGGHLECFEHSSGGGAPCSEPGGADPRRLGGTPGEDVCGAGGVEDVSMFRPDVFVTNWKILVEIGIQLVSARLLWGKTSVPDSVGFPRRELQETTTDD